MTKSQLELVNKMTVSSDTVAVAPSIVFSSLADVRKERGIFYASTLSSTEAHIREIDALSQGVVDDAAIVKKADLYVNVLSSYLRALRSISGTARWDEVGRELRGIGRGLDSVLIAYNKLSPGEELETGHGRALGQSLGFISQEYMKRRQAEAVKEFVTRGDTIVDVLCTELVQCLKKGELDTLIRNEVEGLQSNYASYIDALRLQGRTPSTDDDREYVSLKGELQRAEKVRDRCINALRSLRRAHRRVCTEIQERKKITTLYEEIIELNDQAAELRKALLSE